MCLVNLVVAELANMSFFGKEYTFDRQENFEAFVNSLGLGEEEKKGFSDYYPNQLLKQNGGDSYTIVKKGPKGVKEVTFQSGVPVQEQVLGRATESVYTLNGNVLTQVQKVEGEEFKFVREYSDDSLAVTITSTKFDGTARRFYKAV